MPGRDETWMAWRKRHSSAADISTSAPQEQHQQRSLALLTEKDTGSEVRTFSSTAHAIPSFTGTTVTTCAPARLSASVATALHHMQPPNLTPQQSRLLTSAIAILLLFTLCSSFQPRNLVSAAEIKPARSDWERDTTVDEGLLLARIAEDELLDGPGSDAIRKEEEEEDGGYSGDFEYFDRSLIGRAPEGVEQLKNNEMKEVNIIAKEILHFVFEQRSSQVRATAAVPEQREAENASRGAITGDLDDLEDDNPGDKDISIERRQTQNQVFISVSTCNIPLPNTAIAIDPPPQLTLYVSDSDANQEPGPDKMNNLVRQPLTLQEGYANLTVRTDRNVYIGISAPELARGWVGNWSFEVAVSRERYYHSSNDTETFLLLLDTDSDSALFVTRNLTLQNGTEVVDKWKNLATPFTMYAFNETEWGAKGLERSMCGLKTMFDRNSFKVDPTITTKYGGGSPKAQFHVQNLTANTKYIGYLAVDGNLTTQGLDFSETAPLGSGGRVWKQFQFTTKRDDSCQVIFDLPFCDNTAYAVPSSSRFKDDDQALLKIYDDKAREYMENFNKSLAQIACETTGSAQYSLARTCQNCHDDYKDWLCSVLIPRCEDFDAPGDWLQERNINAFFPNGTSPPYENNRTIEFNETRRDRFGYAKSRNKFIDEIIQPGPYKEILPCEDLCFDIVRSCPAKLEFACPNEPAKSLSYGRRDDNNPNLLRCNFPGAVLSLNPSRGSAHSLSSRAGIAGLVAVAVVTSLWI